MDRMEARAGGIAEQLGRDIMRNALDATRLPAELDVLIDGAGYRGQVALGSIMVLFKLRAFLDEAAWSEGSCDTTVLSSSGGATTNMTASSDVTISCSSVESPDERGSGGEGASEGISSGTTVSSSDGATMTASSDVTMSSPVPASETRARPPDVDERASGLLQQRLRVRRWFGQRLRVRRWFGASGGAFVAAAAAVGDDDDYGDWAHLVSGGVFGWRAITKTAFGTSKFTLWTVLMILFRGGVADFIRAMTYRA